MFVIVMLLVQRILSIGRNMNFWIYVKPELYRWKFQVFVYNLVIRTWFIKTEMESLRFVSGVMMIFYFRRMMIFYMSGGLMVSMFFTGMNF